MTDDSLSDEDKTLFRAHMRTVTPLKNNKKRVHEQQKPNPIPINIRAKSNWSEPKQYHLSDYISEPVLSDSTLSYAHPSLSKKMIRALKNGHIPWECRLDLHGLNVDRARTALCEFIQQQRNNNIRCILLIHGKGGQQGQPPVIKNMVNRWLPQLDEVLAFHSAHPKDGGQGALYVLLRSKN